MYKLKKVLIDIEGYVLESNTNYNIEQIQRVLLYRVLKLNYTNLEMVDTCSYYCNKLYNLENKEVLEMAEFNISIKCHVSINGYDAKTYRYYFVELE